MAASQPPSGILRFGVFEVDIAAGDLRKNGLKIRLQEQPFQVLALLLRRPGKIVTREELQRELWSDDTFVDFDHSLGTAINKIRQALGDSAQSPRFLETVPKRGYRFLAPVERIAVGSPAAMSGTPQHLPNPRGAGQRRWKQVALLAGVALAASLVSAIATLSIRDTRTPARELPTRKFSFPVRNLVFGAGGNADVAISPDGKHIAYVADESLWIHDLTSSQPRRLGGDLRVGVAGLLEWSPDSKFIAFALGDEIQKVAGGGGASVTLCKFPLAGPAIVAGRVAWPKTAGSVAWSRDRESLIFAVRGKRELYEVAARGGAPRLLPETVPPEDEAVHGFRFLPVDGRRVLLYSAGVFGEEPKLVLWTWETGERRVVGSGLMPQYSPSGHVVFQAEIVRPGIWALPFSVEKLRPAGEAFPVAREGRTPSVSTDGTLVYVEAPGRRRELVLLDRSGRKLRTLGQPQRSIAYPAFSPDGGRVAVWGSDDGTSRDIWIHDAERPMKFRLTTHEANDLLPAWSPSGDRVAFSSGRTGQRDLYVKSVDLEEPAELLFEDPTRGQWIVDWSQDGKHLLLIRATGGRSYDLGYLERNGDGNYEAKPLLETPSNEDAAAFSPDARYIAYSSNRSGRFEVYVCSFPECRDSSQVSLNGGRQPRWTKQSGKLYYVEDYAMMEVAISTQPQLSVETPRKLFESPALDVRGSVRSFHYDVKADGERFVVVESRVEGGSAVIHVWQNWFGEFKDGSKSEIQ